MNEQELFLIEHAEHFDTDEVPNVPSTTEHDAAYINAFWTRCGSPKSVDD